MQLVIGNKAYSSWSMRPWLVMTHFDIAFEEVQLWLGQDDSDAMIRKYSPSGQVPCLIDGGMRVWDSLAICETLAERFPERSLWPRSPVARACARSLSAEMHAGFRDLRASMWMNLRADFSGQGRTPGALVDIARIETLVGEALSRHGGPFLCGKAFSIVDAMYAPVAMCFNTWRPALSETTAEWCATITALPAVQSWIAGAHAEGHPLDRYDSVQ
jgi:glutathione S-transferase